MRRKEEKKERTASIGFKLNGYVFLANLHIAVLKHRSL